ncbi:hypothetical protein [Photobacterium rosenbergii]|uniref:Uncharacterized protein n=1 Tax=Photobacterium rosenbergii TaxID=294936 RepID=A0ABU3ZE06_9GAMM|nr:hypothetical protein [Photobacterium rosenbergii]MDV5168335.1 hypothetical protein [Photobacterium rosenbergii]
MKGIKVFILLMLLISTNSASAGSCGKGKIKSILEGGWNDNDYRIVIDYSEGESEHSGTEQSSYIVFRSSLDPSRLTGIKSIVLAAFTTGQIVNTFSHYDDCSNATQVSVWK